jgi:hypothetical protein
MLKPFWRWLAIFAYRRRAVPGPKPVGVPFHRDPDDPCHVYEPRAARPADWADCQGDGHHLCRGCCHLEPGTCGADDHA